MAKAKSALVVVESPTKAKTVGKYLKDLGGEFKQFTVKATVGHLRDLPQRELGVDVEKDFAPKYVTIRGKGKTLAELKKAAKGADAVYLATDPDREGEAIAWHVADQINASARVRRVLFHEITKDAVREAIRHPTEIDERKVDAQQARRILDRLVGYKASPLLWKSIKTGLSAGRVQTVALRLICEREGEIRAFTPKEYWSIEVDLEAHRKKFQAKLHKIAGHRPDLPDEAAAATVVKAVTGKPFVVSAVTRRERRKYAPAPFTTSTLQQEAAKQIGFSAQRTMRTAQQLYEGVEIGKEGAVGLITYMRTDSTRVAPVAIEAVRDYIGREFPAGYLPAKPNTFTGKKAARAQDAHEAIRPSDVWRKPDDLKKALSPDQLKLYRLIWQRFVGSQMAPVVYDTTTIDFEVGKYLFRATGSVVKFNGYHAVFQEGHEAEEGRTLEDLKPVPPLEQGEEAKVRQITPNQHFTEPPPRYSEASLVKELEKRGIGRPSTYASIISTLRARDYVTLAERRFQPTSLGETVSRVLVSRFPDIFNVEFTSEMENELDKVEEGDLGWTEVLHNFYGPFAKALEAIDPEAMIREAHDVSDVEGQTCPECGKGTLRVRTGRFGPFVACSDYPECKFTKPLKRDKVPDRPTDQKCPTCGRPMVIKTGRYGEFLACTGYPECKTTRPIPLGVKCPRCKEGELAERRTKRGRSFFGCSRYPDCDFSTWYRPTPVACPSCGFVGAEIRSTKARGEYRRCLVCETEFAVEEGGHGARRGVIVTVVGGGLAGCEAAWALAERGYEVRLVEMRPQVRTPAHQTDRLAEIVCSNTFKSTELTNAHGLLKAELRRLGSLLLRAADAARVPGGTALAVDRAVFADAVTAQVTAHPRITVERAEVTDLPSPGIVATGPLTSDALARRMTERLGSGGLAFYDAIAPILSAESLDQSRLYRASRYGKGDGDDYLNAPLTREEYGALLTALREGEQFRGHEFDAVPYFEACLPVEEMAARGDEVLRFGPMKPVGLPDPRTGRPPYAVVQLRQEDRAAQMWNLVGFQTRLRIPEQQRIFRTIPGLADAEFLRWGSVHRNTYLNTPAALAAPLAAPDDPYLLFAGQLVGVEGYTESLGTGLFAGLTLARVLAGAAPVLPPAETMLGALLRYVHGADPRHFQPMNANFGLLPALADPPRDKRLKRQRLADRSLAALDACADEILTVPT